MNEMIPCATCRGAGFNGEVVCPFCGGLGEVAVRTKRVLPSIPSSPVYFRGARITKHTGAKK